MTSPMTRVSSLVSRDIGNYLSNKQTWKDIIVNVKSYGAKGDGVTDDSAAIQAAVDDLSGLCGTLVFPPGEFVLLSAGINLLSTIQIIGSGSGHHGTNIVNKSGEHAFKSSQKERDAQGDDFFARILQGFQVRNLRVTDKNDTKKDAFFIEGISNDSGFYNVDIRGVRYGINTTGSFVFDIINCQVDGCAVGVLLGDKVNGPNSDPEYSLECNAINIRGTHFVNHTEAGIKHMIGNMINIDGCTFDISETGGRGIWLLKHPNDQTVENVDWPAISDVDYPSINVYPRSITIHNCYFEHQKNGCIQLGADGADFRVREVRIINNHLFTGGDDTPQFIKAYSMLQGYIKNNNLRDGTTAFIAIDFGTTDAEYKKENYVNVVGYKVEGLYSIHNNISFRGVMRAFDDYVSYNNQTIYVDSVDGDDANIGDTSANAIKTLATLSKLLARLRLNNSLTQVYFVGGSTFTDKLTLRDCGYVNFNVSGTGNVIFDCSTSSTSIEVYENTVLNSAAGAGKIKFLIGDTSGRVGIKVFYGGQVILDSVDFYSDGTTQNTIGIETFEGAFAMLKGSITNNGTTSPNYSAFEVYGSQINIANLTEDLPHRTKQIFVGGISGTTANRPTHIKSGQLYLDTTLVATKGQPIWVDASGTGWIDSTGTTV